MKLILLSSVLLFGLASGEFCYNQVNQHCTHGDQNLKNCTAKYSSVQSVMSLFDELVRLHISHSYQYLLMSTNFGNYMNNREGLSKLFRKLSDRTWEDAVDTIKYMAKRGGAMTFRTLHTVEPNNIFKGEYDTMYELDSLSRALDMSKFMATKVHHIHKEITKKNDKHHDADTINFLEDKFVEKHTQTIRDLAGHTNDLVNLVKDATDSSLSIFLFDEYLKSIY